MNDKDFEIQRWAAMSLMMFKNLAEVYGKYVSQDFQWYSDALRGITHNGKIDYDELRKLLVRFEKERMMLCAS